MNLIKKYEKSGYNVLNIAKGGGLGARSIKWTNEVIKKEALKYNTRSDFERKYLVCQINFGCFKRRIELWQTENYCDAQRRT